LNISVMFVCSPQDDSLSTVDYFGMMRTGPTVLSCHETFLASRRCVCIVAVLTTFLVPLLVIV
jgi:hypothetical protein